MLTSDSQETITDVSSLETSATRTPKNLKLDESHTSKVFSEVQDVLGTGRYLESSESDYHSSDSEYICNPTTLKINPQIKQLRKRSGSVIDSDDDGSSEKNLVWPDKRNPTSKFTPLATTPENNLTTMDRKLSGEDMVVLTELHHSDQTLASDDYNSNINSNTNSINRASVAVNMGDGTGNISRNLRPRQHMDKLSKYYILIKIKINGCIIKLQKFIFIWFYTSLLHDLHMFRISSL